jgi:hypothetical protein
MDKSDYVRRVSAQPVLTASAHTVAQRFLI